jgi:hypothetical protein
VKGSVLRATGFAKTEGTLTAGGGLLGIVSDVATEADAKRRTLLEGRARDLRGQFALGKQTPAYPELGLF